MLMRIMSMSMSKINLFYLLLMRKLMSMSMSKTTGCFPERAIAIARRGTFVLPMQMISSAWDTTKKSTTIRVALRTECSWSGSLSSCRVRTECSKLVAAAAARSLRLATIIVPRWQRPLLGEHSSSVHRRRTGIGSRCII